MDEKALIRNMERRLARLENAVFGSRQGQKHETAADGFAGLKGGLHLLISRGFFRAKRNLAATRQELEKHDYHYSTAAIQTTLNRLSIRTGPLAKRRERGRNLYVNRK